MDNDTIAPRSNASKLPDGWKMYDKYQIRHTDGTPLKGKRYFVLRLDSDDPLEAARVAAAMSAYKGEAPQGNAAKMREALEAIKELSQDAREEMSTAHYPVAEIGMGALDDIRGLAKAALAALPRNCDVGTANEQSDRFDAYCKDNDCRTKPCPADRMGFVSCSLVWGQMPYEKGGAK